MAKSVIDDGGPAFPCGPSGGCGPWDGMTLRHYFAAKAMQGLLAGDYWRACIFTGFDQSKSLADGTFAEKPKRDMSAHEVACCAIEYADAFLEGLAKAREPKVTTEEVVR